MLGTLTDHLAYTPQCIVGFDLFRHATVYCALHYVRMHLLSAFRLSIYYQNRVMSRL